MDLKVGVCASVGAQKKKSISMAVPRRNVAERNVLVKCTMVCLRVSFGLNNCVFV